MQVKDQQLDYTRVQLVKVTDKVECNILEFTAYVREDPQQSGALTRKEINTQFTCVASTKGHTLTPINTMFTCVTSPKKSTHTDSLTRKMYLSHYRSEYSLRKRKARSRNEGSRRGGLCYTHV